MIRKKRVSRQVNKDNLSIKPWINTEYSYKLAKRMEQFRSNPVLGYRPAGSAAEFATGEMLFQEMERIGLKDVHKDAIRVDSWEFHKAELVWNTEDGSEGLRAVLGGYQTNFQTGGPREFGLVYVGKGTAEDYDGKDVKGKLVLERRMVDQFPGISGLCPGSSSFYCRAGRRLCGDS